MKVTFEKNVSDRYHHEMSCLQAAYKDAISRDKPFDEVKRLYEAYKKSREKCGIYAKQVDRPMP